MANVSLQVRPQQNDVWGDVSASLGLAKGPFIELSMPIDETTDPPGIAPRRITAEDVYVLGYRDGDTVSLGTLSSVLRADPDGKAPSGTDRIVIGSKAAINAMMHHVATGRLEMTPDHLEILKSLRTYR